MHAYKLKCGSIPLLFFSFGDNPAIKLDSLPNLYLRTNCTIIVL